MQVYSSIQINLTNLKFHFRCLVSFWWWLLLRAVLLEIPQEQGTDVTSPSDAKEYLIF